MSAPTYAAEPTRRDAGAMRASSPAWLTAWRLTLLALVAVAAGAPGCSQFRTTSVASTSSEPPIVDPARRSGVPLLFVAMPAGAAFQETRQALVTEIAKTFDFSTLVVTSSTTSTEFQTALEGAAPTCVVLMNNSSVRLYRDYQRARPGAKFPPAVIAMTSFLEEIHRELTGTTGIAYEIPGVTAFVALRAVVETPVTRVGVLHGPYAREFVQRQRALAAKEQVELVSVEVSGDHPTVGDIQEALRTLKSVHHIDVLWVLNDNRLLRDGRFLAEAWLPTVESLNVPVIVGAATLVNPATPFGTFAVVPDHAALGVQTANLILDLDEDDWHVEEHPIVLPLSTLTVLDVAQTRTRFGIRKAALDLIDRPLE